MTQAGSIRVGVGGWTFEPWRGVFYPQGLKHKDELAYMVSRLTAIEINATYYSLQTPRTFAKWREATPEGFKFTLKGSRFATNRRELAGAEQAVGRFIGQGLSELGDRLGPIFWQFSPTKRFEPDDFAAFLALLPRSADGLALRHAVEVRHDSFMTPEFPALLRRHDVACVFAHHAAYPEMADVASDFVYARLQKGSDEIPTAYPTADLNRWAARLKTWAEGGEPDGLNKADPSATPERKPRDVFAFIIHEGKVRAPHGAMELIARIQGSP